MPRSPGEKQKQRAKDMEALLADVRACRHCEKELPLGPRPILRASPSARVVIVGQAPGTRVHETGIPWNDPSGDRLRQWLDIDRELFYDERQIAIIPMGFCYPGKGKSGDLPPRKECAELWFDRLWAALSQVRLTIVIGQYAQAHYLGERRMATLTETVRHWKTFLPGYFPLPHPSPRNIRWLQKHRWFTEEVVPALRREFRRALPASVARRATAPRP